MGPREVPDLTAEHRPERNSSLKVTKGGGGVFSSPAPPQHTGALTLQGDVQGDLLRAQRVLSSAGEFIFIPQVHPRQLQHSRV